MDISELEWSEKEKILRILYTKITMGVNPEYWRRLQEIGRKRNNVTNSKEESVAKNASANHN
jgi:hypothetical protein